ncbi:DICT sensory domain-containing protein [Halogeometricum limi]|uniref:Diguanylate Cyclase and Two-component system sensory domain-containing protein n=1 Tax=Halogeometricum limi TaxID=555875 RepID=A0A1I6I5N9_9EURY|nr:DICT sensory domain-containing protein [Halogeometricum limi]SFR61700.1 Diguanylate Cyclase and Two-component system sensory domain-containing protein [Halogeometricum limi]
MTETHTLESLVEDVEASTQTFSLVNYDGPDAEKARVVRYFEPQSVDVREGVTDPNLPRNFAVLHDGDEFVAAAAVEDVHRHVAGGVFEGDAFERRDRPTILAHVDDRTFTSYDMRRMLLASHEVERYAWRTGAGELHAGFQRLSTLASQSHIYDELRASGVDVHVYGAPDASVPPGLVEHASESPEIRDSWFVVYRGERRADHRALVAVETGPREFSGFWTYDEDTVDDVLERLDATYPATADSDAAAPGQNGR